MLTFFHRTPTITLDCFTVNANIMEYTPIVKASKAIPEWWRKLPIEKPRDVITPEGKLLIDRQVNLKSCYGFLEHYKQGAIIENWADIRIKVEKTQYRFFFADGPHPGEHAVSERGEGFKDYHHIKMISPWLFREKTGVKFLFMGAEWSLEQFSFKVLPGVVNYQFNTGTNINLMMPKGEYDILIPVGQPLVHVIPLTEKRLDIRNHLVDDEEYRKVMRYSHGSFSGWRKYVELIRRNDQRKSKCPFGFGE